MSFRLLKGEHIGLVGANGEGKSTFFNIVTGKLQPDEGKIEWAKNVRVGYLDQHTVLEKGMTIREVLKSAFSWLFELETKMNEICDRLGDVDEDTMMTLMEELGTIQDTLTMHDFYVIDAKVEEVARALGLLDFCPKGRHFRCFARAFPPLVCSANISNLRKTAKYVVPNYHRFNILEASFWPVFSPPRRPQHGSLRSFPLSL